MSLKDDVKSYIVKSGESVSSVAEKLDITRSALSQQINNESIRYKTILQIADKLGYEIVWKKKE